MMLINTITLPIHGDERGSLISIENYKTVPFNIKRVYYIFGTQTNVSRGFHAHKALQQVAVCLTGKCRIVLEDSQRRDEFWLDSPTKGLLIGNFVWREMHDFSPDCVLLVLASEHYDVNDYIRSYDDFKQMIKK